MDDPTPSQVDAMKIVGKLKSMFERPPSIPQDEDEVVIQNEETSDKFVDLSIADQLAEIHLRLENIEASMLLKNEPLKNKIGDLTNSTAACLTRIKTDVIEIRRDHEIATEAIRTLDFRKPNNLQNGQCEGDHDAQDSKENEAPSIKIVEDDRLVLETMKQINEVEENIKELQQLVKAFSGTSEDIIYLDLEHKLLGSVMKIDLILAHGNEEIRQRKREVIDYAERCLATLDGNVVSFD